MEALESNYWEECMARGWRRRGGVKYNMAADRKGTEGDRTTIKSSSRVSMGQKNIL